MRLIERFFIDLSQILCDGLILSRSILEISQFLGLTDQLYDIFQFHILIDSLHIGSQGFDFDVVVTTNDTQVSGVKLIFSFIIIFDAFDV